MIAFLRFSLSRYGEDKCKTGPEAYGDTISELHSETEGLYIAQVDEKICMLGDPKLARLPCNALVVIPLPWPGKVCGHER